MDTTDTSITMDTADANITMDANWLNDRIVSNPFRYVTPVTFTSSATTLDSSGWTASYAERQEAKMKQLIEEQTDVIARKIYHVLYDVLHDRMTENDFIALIHEDD